MTKEKLEEILSRVWMRDWSADDASDAIWGETFSDTTPPAPLTPPLTNQPKMKTETQIEEINARARAYAANAAANREAVEALRDAMGGLRYIESEHGRLYGVGWDRVYAKADAAYAAYEAARLLTNAFPQSPTTTNL